MSRPAIEVLGVYELPFDKKMIEEQADILGGEALKGPARTEVEARAREQLASTVLIEVLIRQRDDRFNAGDFTQPNYELETSSWQVVWAEVYLTVDGEKRLETEWRRPPVEKDFRLAFFIHFWDREVPLLKTSYGELRCPDVKKMPKRLRELVTYELLG